MKVSVELCWGGGSRFSYTLTLSDGRRFTLPASAAGYWDNDCKRRARSLLEFETGLPANRFRFEVR